MIPIYQPYFTRDNLSHAHRAIDSGWVSSQGEYLDLAKNEMLKVYQGHKVILTNNGTSATHLLAVALKYRHPHIRRIVVPNNVYVAAWNSFLYDGNYELVPIDASLDTWNFDGEKIEENLDGSTAILVVHNIGNVVNVNGLRRRFPDTIIMEDNCEGFLGRYEGLYSGTSSFASSVSFFGNKNLTSGEGGAFVTRDEEVFEYVNSVKSQGQSSLKFVHSMLGYNYRMTNIQAAILYGQFQDMDVIMEKKARVFEQYRMALEDVPGVVFQQAERDTSHSLWMFGVRFPEFGLQKKQQLELNLYRSGIETRTMFYEIGAHGHLRHVDSDSSNAKILQSQCVILPSFPGITQSQISFIADKIKSNM
jgi:perosamine synthetase